MTSRMFRPARVVLVRILVMLAMTTLAGCSFQEPPKIWEISGGIFGTTYHISVVLPEDEALLQALAEGIERELHKVDNAMSTWKTESELSRFNRLPDQSDGVALSPELYEVIARSIDIAELTQGAFDVTIGPVVNLWGFGPKARPDKAPTDEELAAVLARTGWEYLALDSQTRSLRAEKHQYIDLSGIAKGYGVDAVARYLDTEGVAAYLVEIGGEVNVKGRKPGGDAWRLAIEQPMDEGGRGVNSVVALDRQAMATSGDYRNYYESEGRRYSHTIDPETGKPIAHRLASVTVIADDCMTADALATGFNVLGFDKAMALATRENIPAFFIVRDEQGEGFETHQTPSFSSYLVQ